MAPSSLKDVENVSLKRPALVFTDSDSLANTVKKHVGQSHDKRFRIVVSMLREAFRAPENTSLQWLPTHMQVADPLTKTMEKDILVSFFNSRAFQSVAKKVYASRTDTVSVRTTVSAKQVSNRCLRNLTRQIFVFDFFCEQPDPSIVEFLSSAAIEFALTQPYQFFFCMFLCD